MSNEPLVSVVMTAYNSERYIYQTLKSILNQSYGNIEVIIVLEYGITDKTERIARKVCKKDRRVKIIINDEKLGIAASRNVGLKAASGKYLAIIDSDDIMLRHRIFVQTSFMEKNKNAVLCGGDVFYIDDKGKIIGYNHTMKEPDDIRMGMLKVYPITSPTIFLRREVMIKNGWFQPVNEHSEDMAWLSDYVFKGTVCNLPIPLACYRMSKTSATRGSKKNKATESLYRIRSEICKDKNIVFSDDIFGYGLKTKTEKKIKRAETFIKECIDKKLINGCCDEFNYRLYKEQGIGICSSAVRMWKNIYQKRRPLLLIVLKFCKYAVTAKVTEYLGTLLYRNEINRYSLK